MKNLNIDLTKYNPVDFLWSELIESFGFEKSRKIISQAIDLQKMNGRKNITMPIIFTGTGGTALIAINAVEKETSFNNLKDDQVLIFNLKKKSFQLLQEHLSRHI